MSEAHALWVGQQLVEEIRRHGERTYPNECCGALLGRDSGVKKSGSETPRRVAALLPLDNRNDESPCNRFAVTAEDVQEAEAAARSRNLEVIGWYHSHPDHPARPSEFDREQAWPWYSYIIVSVQKGAAAEMTSWRLNDDRAAYTAEALEIWAGDGVWSASSFN